MNYITIANDALYNLMLSAYFLLAGPGIIYAVAGFGLGFFTFLLIPNGLE